MHLLYQKISERWPFLAVGLLLAGLWATLLIQSSATLSSEDHASQVSYGLTVPNIMAPVIQREGNNDVACEKESLSSCIRLPALLELFSVQK